MIYDPCSMCHGTSVARLSDYLTLCKIDMLVRNRSNERPSRYVDQPSKVGTAGTIAEVTSDVKSPSYRLSVDYSTHIGNRNLTLRLKRELSKQLNLVISRLTNAGIVILQQDNKDIMRLPLYNVVSSCCNFANSRESQWKFCLVLNGQEPWVNIFLNLFKKTRLQVDYVICINQGQVRYLKVPEK